jgi:hypothetical protein
MKKAAARQTRNKTECLRYIQAVTDAIAHDNIQAAACWAGELIVALGMLLESRGENQMNDED